MNPSIVSTKWTSGPKLFDIDQFSLSLKTSFAHDSIDCLRKWTSGPKVFDIDQFSASLKTSFAHELIDCQDKMDFWAKIVRY